MADPFVLDNTGRDGYYYMYGTEGLLRCYRSKNLMDWEPVGEALKDMAYSSDGELTEAGKAAAYKDVWAPEVVYDGETRLYYLFFSATPQADESVSVSGSAVYQLYVAVSKSPYKDFTLVDFSDAASCGAENVHSIDTASYPQYYAKYVFLEPGAYSSFSKSTGGTVQAGYANYAGAIDPHPFVDDNGNKYLYWVDNIGSNGICVVKMENWLKPDWSTAAKVLYAGYYTVADWSAAQQGTAVETVSYEGAGNTINEGPAVVRHDGKYYLTFSVNSYKEAEYQVAQAVADSPMGPFRKLRAEEGGLLLSSTASGSQELTGTGHHSFVVAGGKRYIVYHRHDDLTTSVYARNPAIDEIKWVPIKDKDGKDLEVMVVNGPTCTVQPSLEAFSSYRNIAGEAKVSGSADAAYLTDGLLSVNKGNGDFQEYIPETTITGSTTFTFEFDTVRTVRGIMIYNSRTAGSIFKNISRIELVCESEGREVVRYIDNLSFSDEYYETEGNGVSYVIPGAAACAVFGELYVKSIRITVEVPGGQSSVGLSEIRILGK